MASRSQTYVQVYGSEITAWSQPGGKIWRWAYQRRQRVERLARIYAPKRTGELAESITADFESHRRGVEMFVSANTPYAYFVHEGTEPHMIYPQTPDGRLTFFWYNRGRVFVGRRGQGVHHPGTQGQPFLQDALETVMTDL